MNMKSKWIFSCMSGLLAISTLFASSTLEGTWNPPVFVSPVNMVGIGRPEGGQLDVNLQNQGVVVFSGDSLLPNQSGFVFKTIYSAAYTFGSGWSLPVRISSAETIIFPPARPKYFSQGDPVVAMNSSGYCVAAWEGNLNTLPDGITYDVIITNIRSSGGDWSTVRIPSVISEEVDVENPFVAVNDAGLAVMLWIQFDNNLGAMTMASFLPFGGEWTTPYVLDNYGFQIDFEKTPRVSIDPNGNVVASWEVGSNPPSNEIHAATYNASTGLWTVVVLDPSPNNFTYTYNAIDPNGNAVVTWTKQITSSPDSTFQVMSSFFTYGSGWSAPVAVSAVNFSQDDANVTIDPFGNATATWGNIFIDNNIQTREVYASRKPFGGSWSAPIRISTPGIDSDVDNALVNRTIDVDNEGNVITLLSVGRQEDLQSAFYSIQTGWQQPLSINAPRSFYSNIGLGSCGFALAEWYDGSMANNRVKAADNFAAGLLQAPTNLTVKTCCDKFASQKKCYNILNWDNFPTTCVSAFRLYRNGVLIAEIQAGENTTYVDPTCGKKKQTVYTLTYLNTYGIESPSISVTVN